MMYSGAISPIAALIAARGLSAHSNGRAAAVTAQSRRLCSGVGISKKRHRAAPVA
jgi:hypothetical protein